MAPYFRLGEAQEVLSQKFWGIRPRNPSCGKISLRRGATIFAWFNMIWGAVVVIMLTFVLFLVPLAMQHNHESTVSALKDSKGVTQEEWIEKIQIKPFGVLQFVILATLLIYLVYWYCSWKLNRAIKEQDLPKLKKYFVWAILLVLLSIPTFLFESEIAWGRAFLFDIPLFAFQFMGAMFTHAYIVSLMNSGTQDDRNRIQFNA